MPWSVAGSAGRLAAVWYGTSDGTHNPSSDDNHQAWDVYLSLVSAASTRCSGRLRTSRGNGDGGARDVLRAPVCCAPSWGPLREVHVRRVRSIRPSTFSIVAVDPDAGEAGVAVQSKFLAAGAVVPWARGGTGAVATQAFAEVTFGVRGLDLLEQGMSPQEALDRLLDGDSGRETRQVGIVDMAGRSASFTGAECFEWAGGVTGDGYCCQGNILAGEAVVAGMAEAFERTSGRALARRLVEALRAGQAAGGDRRGQEASGLIVARPGGGYGGNHDRYIDLRVDHHDEHRAAGAVAGPAPAVLREVPRCRDRGRRPGAPAGDPRAPRASGQDRPGRRPVERPVGLHGVGEPRGTMGRSREGRSQGPRVPPLPRRAGLSRSRSTTGGCDGPFAPGPPGGRAPPRGLRVRGGHRRVPDRGRLQRRPRGQRVA